MKCFTCEVPLGQVRFSGRESRSFSTCFTGQRICEDCESEFDRRELPARAVGGLSKRFTGVCSGRELKSLDGKYERSGLVKVVYTKPK